MILLRLIHILAGITWVGAMIFTVFFLIPAVKDEPPLMGKVFQGLMRRKYMQAMPIVAILTILSGLWMIWITSGGHLAMYNSTPSGHTFTMAGGLGILGFLIGMFVARPAGMRVSQLSGRLAEATDGAEKARLQAEIAALQKRNVLATNVVVGLLLLTVAGMAIARYL